MVGLVSGLVTGLAHTVVVRTGLVGGLGITFGTMTYLPRLSLVVRMPGVCIRIIRCNYKGVIVLIIYLFCDLYDVIYVFVTVNSM